MSKWIVFITIVHEEMTFSADLRSEGERSVATYPLLAAPTKAIAELVVARLNHQHGLPEEAGTDDWQEFAFKAESELTPQEVAMALDLNDPAYPKNGRHPSWLSEMVTAAKTAMADVVKHPAASPKQDDPAYLFVGSPITPSGSGTAPPPMGTPEQRIERIGPLLSSLVAVDDGILSLGTRLRSLPARGNAANTHALTVEVQDQLHKWIDPIVKHLKNAETASNGVGPHLVGLIAEPVAWEVDTRLAIRTLKDQLVGLIYSNGGVIEESFVVRDASSLWDRGQRLQAACEAISAQAEPPQPPASSNGTRTAPNLQPTPMVVLGRAGDPCTVKGKKKKALTDGQYAVVAELIKAGDEGLTKDAIEAVRSSARRMLDDLRKDSDWAGVIIMPGQTNGRYRVRT